VAAPQKHAAALRARYALEVEATLGNEPDVPLPTKEALYRIAQEALHNTVKHAQAKRVWLRLETQAGAITLETRDDGAGFDAGGEFPGTLAFGQWGRVERLGGSLAIHSVPGDGTRVLAHVRTCTRAPSAGTGARCHERPGTGGP
jgi:signal transduction histidine kinase